MSGKKGTILKDNAVTHVAGVILQVMIVIGISAAVTFVVFDISLPGDPQTAALKATFETTDTGHTIRIEHLGGDTLDFLRDDIRVSVNGIEVMDYPDAYHFSTGDTIFLATPATVTTKRININTATSEQLQELHGIGPSIAQSLIDYRTEHGPFGFIQELENVSGIGSATVGNIIDQGYATVKGSTVITPRININTADHEQLQELHGIGPSIAQSLIDYRTENGPFGSIQELENVSGIGSATVSNIIDQGYAFVGGASLFDNIPVNTGHVQESGTVNIRFVDGRNNLTVADMNVRIR